MLSGSNSSYVIISVQLGFKFLMAALVLLLFKDKCSKCRWVKEISNICFGTNMLHNMVNFKIIFGYLVNLSQIGCTGKPFSSVFNSESPAES